MLATLAVLPSGARGELPLEKTKHGQKEQSESQTTFAPGSHSSRISGRSACVPTASTTWHFLRRPPPPPPGSSTGRGSARQREGLKGRGRRMDTRRQLEIGGDRHEEAAVYQQAYFS